MAKALKTFEFQNDADTWYLVGYDCDGNETTREEVPCPCGDDGGENPPPILPGLDRCQVNKIIWKTIYPVLFKPLYDAVDDFWVTPTIVPVLQIIAWMTANGIDSGYYNSIANWFLVNRENGDGALSAYWDDVDLYFGQVIECCLPAEPTFNAGVIACLKFSLFDSPYVNLLGVNNEAFMRVLGGFIGIFPTAFWEDRYMKATIGTIPDPYACGDFNPCGGLLNCADYDESSGFISNPDSNDWNTYSPAFDPHDLPGEQMSTFPGALVWNTTYTMRGFQIPTNQGASGTPYQVCAIRKVFDEPIAICSVETDNVIYLNSNVEDTIPWRGNSSRIALYYLPAGSTSWALLTETLFPINAPVYRNLRWTGVPVLADAILAVHVSGGRYGAIRAIYINVGAILPEE